MTVFPEPTRMLTEKERIVANTVLAARKARGISAEVAAEQAGITARTWARVEKGMNVRPHSLRRISTYFGLEDDAIASALVRPDGEVELARLLGVDLPGPDGVPVYIRPPGWQPPSPPTPRATTSAQYGIEVGTPPVATVELATDLMAALARQPDRTPAAEEALQALHRLLPELWAN